MTEPERPTQQIVLLQKLASTPNRIAQVAGTLPGEMVDWLPGPERWSARMVVSHLFNCEPLFQARLERILSEENAFLPRFGPEEARPDSGESLDALVDGFRGRRQATLSLLYRLQPDDWHRAARHETQGPTSLHKQVVTFVNHDTAHLGQLHDLRQLIEAQAAHIQDSIPKQR
jgi:uncharacterized damage-inducible protein DinB